MFLGCFQYFLVVTLLLTKGQGSDHYQSVTSQTSSFFFVAEDHSQCDNSNLKKINQIYIPSHYQTEVSGVCANSENHDRFLSLFTALIESSFRHTTEHVTREIICLRFIVLSETELKTKLFLTFGFVYHPLKITLATQWNILFACSCFIV